MSDQVLTLAVCVKLTLVDTTILAYTEHDADLTVTSLLHKAVAGYNPSAVRSTEGAAPDNLEATFLMDDIDIIAADLIAGRFDGARIEVYEVDWTNLGAGIYRRKTTGFIGPVSVQDDLGTVDFFSLAQLLETVLGENYSPICQARLFDTRCGIEDLPAIWTSDDDVEPGDRRRASSYDAREYEVTTGGTTNDTEGEPSWDTDIGDPTVEVDGVEWICRDARTKECSVTNSPTNKYQFLDSSRYEADAEFAGGKLVWLTGDNVGYPADIKVYTLSTKEIELYEPAPFTIANGDTCTITQGCDRLWDTCKSARFNNGNRNRSFPFVPGKQTLLGERS